MKSRVLLTCMIALFALSATGISVLAQDVKIGYIDSIKIFAEYKETQDAEAVYKKEVDVWKAQAAKMEQDIVKLQDEIKAQSLMLSEEKQKEKRLALDTQMQEYQKFMQDTFGDDGIAAKRNKELTQPIIEKINRILEKMGQDDGYTLIFDASNANIVYADKALDLTERVLEELNKLGQ